MLALGETDRVRESRLVIQQALEPRVRSTVEQVLGRRTVAFMTGVDVRHGIAINVCTIVPALSEGATTRRPIRLNARAVSDRAASESDDCRLEVRARGNQPGGGAPSSSSTPRSTKATGR